MHIKTLVNQNIAGCSVHRFRKLVTEYPTPWPSPYCRYWTGWQGYSW